jgi:hypothetical protein
MQLNFLQHKQVWFPPKVVPKITQYQTLIAYLGSPILNGLERLHYDPKQIPANWMTIKKGKATNKKIAANLSNFSYKWTHSSHEYHSRLYLNLTEISWKIYSRKVVKFEWQGKAYEYIW